MLVSFGWKKRSFSVLVSSELSVSQLCLFKLDACCIVVKVRVGEKREGKVRLTEKAISINSRSCLLHWSWNKKEFFLVILAQEFAGSFHPKKREKEVKTIDRSWNDTKRKKKSRCEIPAKREKYSRGWISLKINSRLVTRTSWRKMKIYCWSSEEQKYLWKIH